MKMDRGVESVDSYITKCEPGVRPILQSLRELIREEAPGAVEVISYGMPAFKLTRVLVYFAAQKNHLGFYPTSSGISHFEQELKGYKHSKGAIQFPYDKPLPYDLIRRIVEFRLNEEENKS